jgi:two-component system nitrate/nitrite response regulator NarP
MARILIGCKTSLLCLGLRSLFNQENDLNIVGEVENESDIEQIYLKTSPDVLLLDLNILDFEFLSEIRTILKQTSPIKLVVMLGEEGLPFVKKLVQIGINGLILKEENPDAFICAIHSVVNDGLWFSQKVTEVLKQNQKNFISSVELISNLTERELEVIELLAQGNANDAIAKKLVVAEGTIKNHLVNNYQKLDMHSRAETVAWYWKLKNQN